MSVSYFVLVLYFVCVCTYLDIKHIHWTCGFQLTRLVIKHLLLEDRRRQKCAWLICVCECHVCICTGSYVPRYQTRPLDMRLSADEPRRISCLKVGAGRNVRVLFCVCECHVCICMCLYVPRYQTRPLDMRLSADEPRHHASPA